MSRNKAANRGWHRKRIPAAVILPVADAVFQVQELAGAKWNTTPLLADLVQLASDSLRGRIECRQCDIISGDLPSKQSRLVLAWAELHQGELLADWTLAASGELPFKIQPLR